MKQVGCNATPNNSLRCFWEQYFDWNSQLCTHIFFKIITSFEKKTAFFLLIIRSHQVERNNIIISSVEHTDFPSSSQAALPILSFCHQTTTMYDQLCFYWS